MKAIRKKEESNTNSSHDRSDKAAGFDRIGGMTIRKQTRNLAYPEVWGYIRPKHAESSFECHHCAQTFQSFEQLRQHEVDCLSDSDKANEPL